MNEEDFVGAAATLPEKFADRLRADQLAAVQRYARVGEWDEEVELLIGCLRKAGATVTSEERELLATLLTEMRLPTDQLDMVASAD